jgi:hypothetical protein
LLKDSLPREGLFNVRRTLLRSIKIRVAGISAALVLAAAAPAGTMATPIGDGEQAVAAKPCTSGYTHAVMPDGAHKCLRAGQFCSHKRGWQRAYHRYGLHCKRNGHLTYY